MDTEKREMNRRKFLGIGVKTLIGGGVVLGAGSTKLTYASADCSPHSYAGVNTCLVYADECDQSSDTCGTNTCDFDHCNTDSCGVNQCNYDDNCSISDTCTTNTCDGVDYCNGATDYCATNYCRGSNDSCYSDTCSATNWCVSEDECFYSNICGQQNNCSQAVDYHQ